MNEPPESVTIQMHADIARSEQSHRRNFLVNFKLANDSLFCYLAVSYFIKRR